MNQHLYYRSSQRKSLPSWLTPQRICLQCGRPGGDPWDGESLWKREWQPSPVFWPGEFHGKRSRARYSPWGCRESDTTKWLSTGKTRKLWMEKLTSKGKCAEMRGNHPHTNMISKPANIRSSVQSLAQSCPTLWDPMYARPPCPSPTPGAYPNSCPSSQWCHPAISSSVVPFSSRLQSSSASGSSPKRDEDKCKILEMHLKLKDQQLKTILFICRRLFQNIVGTTNWKSTIDIHTQRKRNPNTTLNLVIEPQENKRKGEDKNPYKDKFKTIKKWQ